MRQLVGVDGCRAGWVALSDSGGSLDACVHADWPSLMRRAAPDAIIAVDIPIGLPNRGARTCDLEARRYLGVPRCSSVFPSPVLACLPRGSYEAICARHRKADGRGLSRQAFHLLPKIREVDGYLLGHAQERSRIFEVHPEVSFAAWNAGNALRHRKLTAAGRRERLSLIESAWNGERERLWAVVRGTGCHHDDLNDAFAALWTARRIASGTSRALPEIPEADDRGIRMAIFV